MNISMSNVPDQVVVNVETEDDIVPLSHATSSLASVVEADDDVTASLMDTDSANSVSLTACNSQSSTVSMKQKPVTSVRAAEKPYQCEVCHKRLATSQYLENHMRMHSTVMPHSYQVNDQNSMTPVNPIDVQKTFHEFDYDNVYKELEKAQDLACQAKRLSGDKVYKCEFCDERFVDPKTRLFHCIKTHDGEKLYKCEMCDARFSHVGALSRHRKTHKGEVQCKCEVCDATFTRYSALVSHLRTTFKCDVCDKSFANAFNMKRHKTTHTGEEPYECETCDRRFLHSYALRVHEMTHTGEKPLQCDVCGKKIASGMRRHMRTHTGEKPYKCGVCNRRFAGSSTLRNHRMTHTGEKPFECEVCHRRFRDSGVLKRHVASQHPEKASSDTETEDVDGPTVPVPSTTGL